MYGKTLEDYPDRFEAFHSVLSEFSVDAMNAGFAWCLKHSDEFPVPAEVRQAVIDQMQAQEMFALTEKRRQDKLIDDAKKAERFTAAPLQIPATVEVDRAALDTETELLRQEFQDMLAKHQLQTFDSRGEVRAGRKRPKWVQEFLDSKRETDEA